MRRLDVHVDKGVGAVKWEYCTLVLANGEVSFDTMDGERCESLAQRRGFACGDRNGSSYALASLGEQGWEAYSAGAGIIWLKRPKQG